MLNLVGEGSQTVSDRARNVVGALQIVLGKRYEIIQQLGQEPPSVAMDRRTLQERLTHLTRQQHILLAELQRFMPPEGVRQA